MRSKTSNNERVQQSGNLETKDLLTLATLTNDGEQIIMHVEVMGKTSFGGFLFSLFELCAYRDSGTVNVNGATVFEASAGFYMITFVADGDDVKLTMSYGHPTTSSDVDVDIDWTVRPFPS